jgi:tetratricopeptide (TPR) repeat protein
VPIPTGQGARSVPGTGTKTATAGDASPPLLPDVLTDAGRITAQYEASRPGPIAARPVAASPATATARPPQARVRAAHQQAVLATGLARGGKHTAAIQRFKQSVALDPTVAAVQHNLGLACLQAGRLEEAVLALGCAIRLNPELASAHASLADTLDLLGRENEAVVAYEAAVRLEPGQHSALAALAQIHLKNDRRAEAEDTYRAAAAAAAGTHIAGLYNARAASAAGAPAEAEALLRALIVDEPACGVAHLVLGYVLAQGGRSDEAVASFERSIALEPANAGAWYHVAINRTFNGRDHELIDRMHTCLVRLDLTSRQRQAVNFALGKAYSDLGDYAAAMRCIDAANALRGARVQLDRTLLARQTDHAIAATPPGYLERRPDFGIDDATPILIVGMPRSGTTLVEQILSSHPDVVAGGELGFWRESKSAAGFDVFATAAHSQAVRRVAHDYLGVLRTISPTAARVTDKRPFNFQRLGIIRQIFPRATIVHCRRHPIDTCLSIFATDFGAPLDFAGDRGSLVFFYHEYQRLMAHWREVLPPDRFIEVDYEALVAAPEPLTRQLIATCGLEWNDACLAPHLNQRQITTASLWQARQPIYRTSVERWRRYEPWLGELRALLPSASDGTQAGSSF